MPQFVHAELMPDHSVILSVTGVVAYQTPDQIAGAVRAAIVRWAPDEILLDLVDVSVLDAAGISALLDSLRTAAWAGVPVVLINVGAYLMGQLRETGLADVVRAQAPVQESTAESAPGSTAQSTADTGEVPVSRSWGRGRARS